MVLAVLTKASGFAKLLLLVFNVSSLTDVLIIMIIQVHVPLGHAKLMLCFSDPTFPENQEKINF